MILKRIYSRSLSTCVVLMLLISFISLLPLSYLGDEIGSHFYTSDQLHSLSQNLASADFRNWVLITLFVAFPMSLQLYLDRAKIRDGDSEKAEWLSDLMLNYSIIVPNLILLLLVHAGTSEDENGHDVVESNISLSYNIIYLAQQIQICCSVLIPTFQHKLELNSKRAGEGTEASMRFHTINILFIFFLCILFRQIGNFADTRAVFLGFYYLSVVAGCFGIGYFGLVTISTIRALYKQKEGSPTFLSHHHFADFYRLTGLLTYSLAILTMSSALQGLGMQASQLKLVIYQVLQVILIYYLNVIPTETMRLVAELKQLKLETRLNLIRYVSHEMRTPLNTAFMGQAVLLGGLEKLKAVLGEIHRTVQETGVFDKVGSEKPSKRLSVATETGFYVSRSNLMSSSRTNVDGFAGLNTGENAIVRMIPRNDNLSPIASVDESSGFKPSQYDDKEDFSTHSPKTPHYCPHCEIFLNLLRNLPKSETVEDIIDTCEDVTESCNVAISTLDDLLTFDKLDEKKLVIELEEINPWGFVNQTAKPFHINANQTKVKLRVFCVKEETNWFNFYFIKADRFKLSQVMRNLISNAMKFTPKDKEVKVYIERIRSENPAAETTYSLRLTVEDQGFGISPRDLKRLFGQYVQINPGKLQQGKGSGLGLWISKSIVEMHRGKIEAFSEGEGRGCKFTVELPLHRKKHRRMSKSNKTLVKNQSNLSKVDEESTTGGIGTPRIGSARIVPVSAEEYSPPFEDLPAENSTKIKKKAKTTIAQELLEHISPRSDINDGQKQIMSPADPNPSPPGDLEEGGIPAQHQQQNENQKEEQLVRQLSKTPSPEPKPSETHHNNTHFPKLGTLPALNSSNGFRRVSGLLGSRVNSFMQSVGLTSLSDSTKENDEQYVASRKSRGNTPSKKKSPLNLQPLGLRTQTQNPPRTQQTGEPDLNIEYQLNSSFDSPSKEPRSHLQNPTQKIEPGELQVRSFSNANSPTDLLPQGEQQKNVELHGNTAYPMRSPRQKPSIPHLHLQGERSPGQGEHSAEQQLMVHVSPTHRVSGVRQKKRSSRNRLMSLGNLFNTPVLLWDRTKSGKSDGSSNSSANTTPSLSGKKKFESSPKKASLFKSSLLGEHAPLPGMSEFPPELGASRSLDEEEGSFGGFDFRSPSLSFDSNELRGDSAFSGSGLMYEDPMGVFSSAAQGQKEGEGQGGLSLPLREEDSPSTLELHKNEKEGGDNRIKPLNRGVSREKSPQHVKSVLSYTLDTVDGIEDQLHPALNPAPTDKDASFLLYPEQKPSSVEEGEAGCRWGQAIVDGDKADGHPRKTNASPAKLLLSNIRWSTGSFRGLYRRSSTLRYRPSDTDDLECFEQGGDIFGPTVAFQEVESNRLVQSADAVNSVYTKAARSVVDMLNARQTVRGVVDIRKSMGTTPSDGHPYSSPLCADNRGLLTATHSVKQYSDPNSGILASQEGNSAIPRSWNTGLRFLLVDDSATSRKVCGKLLKQLGHSVEEAENGQVCIELISLGLKGSNGFSLPDVVLMDENMPVLGGLESTEELRALGFYGLVYGVTGNLEENDKKRFLDKGANWVFGKPLDIQQLKNRLDSDLASNSR